ncbi:hypothetical protein OQA88_6092 [Cercophora sp. LCS_1]
MEYSACVPSTEASEWCFDTSCFDPEKLRKHHEEHAGTTTTAPETARSIDILCHHCRQTFSQKPSIFIYDSNTLSDPPTDFKAYVWTRIDKRDAFLADLRELHPTRAETVISALKKLAEDREEFAKYGPKKRLLVSLDGWRGKWATGGPESNSIQDEGAVKNDREHRQSAASTEPLTLFTNLSARHDYDGFGVSSATTTASAPPIQQSFHGHYKVGVMHFKRKAENQSFSGVTLKTLAQSFPDQRIPIEDVLSTAPDKLSNNPVVQRCDENTLRYFHIPANNMSWVEETMARYYGERRRKHDDSRAVEDMLRHERLLRREFWRGQTHGGNKGPVHARHMRPRSSVIPRPQAAQPRDRPPSSGKDIALFLPYLHWEYHSLQKRIQSEIDDAKDELKLQRQEDSEEKKRMRRQKTRFFSFDQGGESGAASPIVTPGHGNKNEKGKKLVGIAVDHLRDLIAPGTSDESDGSSEAEDGPQDEPRKKKKVKSRKSILANLLWTVAQIYSEMEFGKKFPHDTRMLRTFVHHDPPLHIRRTLDQFYFHTLDDTGARDCDQVVHRGTRGARDHTRIIMVDQLWLWILDDNTIITAFPKRWGRNKLDDSGVHKSIRVRLKTAHKDGIKSIYHLALIIIDQCSRVFFDRTKSRDNRPEMLDLFGSAIGNTTEFTCISHHHFWRHINRIASNSLVKATAEKWRFLDINLEGKLLQESQDICEELMILLRVYSQQITVIKEFRRHLATLKEEETRAQWKETERSRIESHEGTADPATLSESAMVEFAVIRKLDRLLSWHLDTSMSPFSDDDIGRIGGGMSSTVPTQEADVLLELVESRRLELQELEETALRTCNQLEGLLSLKQQQASILEAKAAKIRADESIKQGRSIIAFTIVTIFFLPLGFFAAFFGMNNSVSTKDEWMTLNDQVQYMFGFSAVVVVIATSLAFSQTARTAVSLITILPLSLVAEHLGLGQFWRKSVVQPLLKLGKSGKARQKAIAGRREPERGLVAVTTIGKKTDPAVEERLKILNGVAEDRVSGDRATSWMKTPSEKARQVSLSGLLLKARELRRQRAPDHGTEKV